MSGLLTSFWFWAAVALLAAVFWPHQGLWAGLRRRGDERRRSLCEDALKHIHAWERRAKNATPESLAGALGLSQRRVLDLITSLEAKGLVQSVTGGVQLTPAGEAWALHVVRAHRLWERYLSDEAGFPMSKLHQAAERAEHHLSAENLDVLDAHLGHPQHDPHGDPIPAADGTLRPETGIALVEWPADKPARVVHIEDEPEVIFKQILATGIRPGMTIRVLEKTPQRIVVSDGENEHRLAHVVAGNVQVAAPLEERVLPPGTKRLSALVPGESAVVFELDEECRGFTRRRLQDLGLTPDARVEAALENPFGDPRAFRVRGTMIALRSQQADHIWVRPATAAPVLSGQMEATRV
jgi:DtxR family transcriptional regulator, Mn-dependent transcriptional regulator